MSQDGYIPMEAPELPGGSIVAALAALVGLALIGVSLRATLDHSRAAHPVVIASSTSAGFDPAPYLLNALLAPALDPEELPLRWVDPRPAMACGPHTAVRVNGKPLRPGTLVPDVPFVLDWQADGCRPFGIGGARFDGRVSLTIYREDWGFSASVEPEDLRIEVAPGQAHYLDRGSAVMPLSGGL